MSFDALVKKRKSVRSFKSKKANWKDVLAAVDCASQGPFAGNNNNLRFLIVENKEKIKQLATFAEQEWIAESGIIILVCADETHLENVYGERGRVYSRQQAGAAIQTIMLKLTELGLSSCWVGSYSDHDIKNEFKIPHNIQIEAVIPVGYEKEVLSKKGKKDLESVLFWEEWEGDRRPTKNEETKEDYSPD